MLRDLLGDGFSHVLDAERKEQARQRLRAGLRNRGYELLGALLGQSLEPDQRLGLEVVQPGGVANQAFAHQLADARIRESSNVHRAARGEVDETFQLPA